MAVHTRAALDVSGRFATTTSPVTKNSGGESRRPVARSRQRRANPRPPLTFIQPPSHTPISQASSAIPQPALVAGPAGGQCSTHAWGCWPQSRGAGSAVLHRYRKRPGDGHDRSGERRASEAACSAATCGRGAGVKAQTRPPSAPIRS